MPVMTSSRKLVTTSMCRKRSKGVKRVYWTSSVLDLMTASRKVFESVR